MSSRRTKYLRNLERYQDYLEVVEDAHLLLRKVKQVIVEREEW